MAVIDQLQSASFRGFDFLVNSESNESGKKIVTHEYPNSNKRYSEELGTKPDRYTINAIIHGDVGLRIDFENILRRPGLGTLVHPIYGISEVMVSGYTVSADQTKIGEFRFAITFEKSEQNITPSPETSAETKVSDDADTAVTNIGNAFESTYDAPSYPFSFSEIRQKLEDTIEIIGEASNNIVNPIQAAAAEFTSTIAVALSGVTTIMQDAEQLRQVFDDIWLAVQNLVDTPADLADFWGSLTNYDTIEYQESINHPVKQNVPASHSLESDTAQRDERTRGVAAISEYVRLVASVRKAESAAFKQYKTETQLNEEREIISQNISKKFDRDIEFSPTNSGFIAEDKRVSLATYPDVQEVVGDLKVSLNNTFSKKLEAVFRVITKNIYKSDAALLAFDMYGDLELIDNIVDLNPEKNSSFITGDTKLVAK